MFNFSNFFLEKNWFFGQEKYCYFWKLYSFSKTLPRLKKWNFATVPPDPLRGRVIAFKWPGRPPPEKNPGDAAAMDQEECSDQGSQSDSRWKSWRIMIGYNKSRKCYKLLVVKLVLPKGRKNGRRIELAYR